MSYAYKAYESQRTTEIRTNLHSTHSCSNAICFLVFYLFFKFLFYFCECKVLTTRLPVYLFLKCLSNMNKCDAEEGGSFCVR